MSRTLKVTGNNVKFACFVLFSVSEEAKKHEFHFFFVQCIIKKLLSQFGFCSTQNNKDLGQGYQPQSSASADNSYLDLDYSGYHKTSSNNCLKITSLKTTWT